MRYVFASILIFSLVIGWLWPSQSEQDPPAPLTSKQRLAHAAIPSSAPSIKPVTDWRLSHPLQLGLSKLEAGVQQQDINATYQLGRNLSWCFYSADSDEAHQQKLDELRRTGDSSSSFANNYDRYEYCRGISREQKNRFASLLMDAAQAGHPQAAVEIGKVSAKLYLQARTIWNGMLM